MYWPKPSDGMQAIDDTNVVVRYLTSDDPEQQPRQEARSTLELSDLERPCRLIAYSTALRSTGCSL